MESLRHQRSPGSDRFLGLFSPPGDSVAASAGGVGVELHEDEILWTTAPPDSPDRGPHHSTALSPNPSPFSSPSSRAATRRPSGRSLGILAALPEDDGNRLPGSSGGGGPLLQRKTSISSASSTASNSPSSSTTSTASRMIPTIQKPKAEYSLSLPAGGRIHQPQSAPVNVPLAPRRTRRTVEELDDGRGDANQGDDEEMLPPHEIVARTYARSPMAAFSVLEGAGRTLKGRDLHRVRNAVLRQTGFLD